MRAVFLIALDSLIQGFRSKKTIIFAILYFVVFGLFIYAILEAQKQILISLEAQGISANQAQFFQEMGMNVLKWSSDTRIAFLASVPFLNWGLFIVTLFGTPLLILLINNGRIATDIDRGTIRYLLFRVGRWQIYLGRWIAAMIEVALVGLLVLILALLWAKWQIPGLDAAAVWSHGLRLWLISLLPLSVFVSLSVGTSAIMSRPFTAQLAAVVGFLLFIFLLFRSDVLSPFNWQHWNALFSPTSPELFQSLAVYALMSLILSGAAFARFATKDLQ